MDTLQKYSYLIIGAKDFPSGRNTWFENATGYFIRKGTNLYFATNYHVVTQIDPINKVPVGYLSVDTFYIRINSRITHKSFLCMIDVRSVQKSFHWRRADSLADLFICKINLPKESEVYSIEKLIREKTASLRDSDKIYVYGYPRTVKFPSSSSIWFGYNSVLASQLILNYNKNRVNLNGSFGNVDKTDFQADAIPISNPKMNRQGFSGSPAFSKVGNNFMFVGTIFASNPDGSSALFVKPNSLFELLRSPKYEMTGVKVPGLKSTAIKS